MSATNPNDPRASLPPHVRALLEQMDATLAQIPVEDQERIVRELVEEANRQVEAIQRATERIPEVFKRIDRDLKG